MIAIGDMVLYTLDEDDCRTIAAMRQVRIGPVAYNPAVPEQTFPATVVMIAPNGSLNLKVALDGDDWYWKQFATKSTDPMSGYWSEKSDWKPL